MKVQLKTKQVLTPDGQSPVMAAAASNLINEPELLRRLPICKRTLGSWKARKIIPYIKPPGGKRVLYHWPSIEAALVRMQRGAEAA